MHRINTDGATVDGHFKEAPAPATALGAPWLNMIQGELENIVTNPQGGDRALDIAQPDQLLSSILAMIGRAISNVIAVSAGATGQIAIGGIIVKWGGYRETVTDEVSRSVSFAVDFPAACWRIITQPVVAGAGDEQDLWTQVLIGSVSVSGFSVQFQDSDNTDNRAAGFDWLAIGN